MEVSGKTIVITGASRGLGQNMATTLAGRGAKLALVDLDEKELQETEELCSKEGGEVRRYSADVSAEADVQSAFERIASDFGGIHGLINNAGTNRDGLLVKAKDGQIQTMSVDDFNKVVAVDLTGVFLCGREAAVHMIRGDHGGVIINISSIARVGNVGQSNYAAAKAGVSALTVTWAMELARYGIRVACIAPGYSDTQMVQGIKSEMQDKIRKKIPLQRFGKPEEIGHSALFIFENAYFHGRTLEVDGGLRI